MNTYGVKGHEFVDPFQAKNDEEAAGKALKILGFNYIEADKLIKKLGNLGALKHLEFELERL